jgi:hypothetical protein
MLGFSYYLLCFLFNKIRKYKGSSAEKRGRRVGEVAQIMYTYVSKCKNDKIKFKKYSQSPLYSFAYYHSILSLIFT